MLGSLASCSRFRCTRGPSPPKGPGRSSTGVRNNIRHHDFRALMSVWITKNGFGMEQNIQKYFALVNPGAIFRFLAQPR